MRVLVRQGWPGRLVVAALALVLVAAAMVALSSRPTAVADIEPAAQPAVPRPDHVVVVVLENKHRSSVVGSADAPYLNSLARSGANLSQSYGVTHPSQPNYLALFSGSQHGVTSNDCPLDLATAPNLGRQLLDAGMTFTGYSESLPAPGYLGCAEGDYMRKHSPWVNFGLPAHVNQPFTAFPSDYTRLPTVAFVTPNMCHDMHDCPVSTGDRWLQDNLDGYARWARTHNSLLVVTFDENAGGTVNQITTLLVGQSVRPGSYDEPANHYTLLRTLEDAYGLRALGHAADARSLRTIWTTAPARASRPTGVANGSFELGDAGWAMAGTTASANTSRHGGTLAWRAGSTRATVGDSTISQTFTAPAGRTRLKVSWLGRCSGKVSRDWATILLSDQTTGRTQAPLRRSCRSTGGWRTVTARVTPGHRYTVTLVSHDDGRKSTPNRTTFDDVVLV